MFSFFVLNRRQHLENLLIVSVRDNEEANNTPKYIQTYIHGWGVRLGLAWLGWMDGYWQSVCMKTMTIALRQLDDFVKEKIVAEKWGKISDRVHF